MYLDIIIIIIYFINYSYSWLTWLIARPVANFTGMFKMIFPAISLLFILDIPCPVKTTLFILCFTPWFIISLLTNDSYAYGIALLVESLKRVKSKYPLHPYLK